MSDQLIANDLATEQLLAVLTEGQSGPAGDLGYYADDGGGLQNTLDALTAEEASRDIAGSSIVAHVHHILFSFRAFGTYIAGQRVRYDWSESWAIQKVTDAEWDGVRARVGAAFDEVRGIIASHPASNARTFRGSLATVTHLAYHLGAIRQKVAVLRSA
jgi:hypothetical protein